MRKANVLGICCLAMSLAMSTALAEQPATYHITGTELLDYCQDTLSMMDKKAYNVSKSSWCIGFVQGAITSHRFYSTFYAVQDPKNKSLTDTELGSKIQQNQVFCVPNSVTLGVLVKDVVSYLKSNPQFEKEQASMGVARALNKSYPCN